MKKPPGTLSELKINRSWTLFLDRDGVINKKLPGDYVRSVKQFRFLPGVKDSLVKLSKVFGRIIIVTNQQGVGKGLMTKEDVEEIHAHLKKVIEKMGGRIDAIYFAPQLKEKRSPMRKPGIGMALKAKKDFPAIRFSKSIMVGDSFSDMEFAYRAGMLAAFISRNLIFMSPDGYKPFFVCDDLAEFAREVKK